ncbi:hypothetical protein, partial [Nocardia brasiliensis]|uniref:hypothetical protein n=1 Tax=Nocardia brasiliensis TaxID=37326 RepID=UPI0024550AF9
ADRIEATLQRRQRYDVEDLGAHFAPNFLPSAASAAGSRPDALIGAAPYPPPPAPPFSFAPH